VEGRGIDVSGARTRIYSDGFLSTYPDFLPRHHVSVTVFGEKTRGRTCTSYSQIAKIFNVEPRGTLMGKATRTDTLGRIWRPSVDEQHCLVGLERDSDRVDIKEGSFSEELQKYRALEPDGRRVERSIQR